MKYLRNIKQNLMVLMVSFALSACATNPVIVSTSIQPNADLLAPEQEKSYLTEMEEAVCPLIGCSTSQPDVRKPSKKPSVFKSFLKVIGE